MRECGVVMFWSRASVFCDALTTNLA